MIKRDILSALQKELRTDKIIVLTGMRRVGKTTLIRYLYDHIDRERKVFLDLENPLNQTMFATINYDNIKAILDRVSIGMGTALTVFLDEIQNVKHLPSIVKYLYDHYHIKFILTGSASFYLKNLFSESLAGRKRIFELYPLNFQEFLSAKNASLIKPSKTENISNPLYLLFEPYVNEYLTYGGFPSVLLSGSHEEKLNELDDIFTSYYQKEILLLSDFHKLEMVKATIQLLLVRTGSKLDISKIASELGSSRITISEYLNFLEQTYFFKRIKPFSPKIDVVLRGQSKAYICDNGFFAKNLRISDGALLENAVFNLLRTQGEVYYYQSHGGAEIDFIVDTGKDPLAYEVKIQARAPDVRRVAQTARKLGIKKYFVVSQKFSPLPHVIYPFQL